MYISYFIKLKMVPYEPRSWFNGIAQFDLLDVCNYGPPEDYGYFGNYNVLDNFEVSRPFVLDYGMECDRYMSLRPIHHYDEVKRFESTIRQLVGGCRNEIGSGVVEIVCNRFDRDPLKCWNSVRSILKEIGASKYYNRIPEILEACGYDKKLIFPDSITTIEIINDFKIVLNYFRSKEWFGRVYMPNYRFIALKLMEKNGVIFEYYIPLLKVKKKLEMLNKVWEEIEQCFTN